MSNTRRVPTKVENNYSQQPAACFLCCAKIKVALLQEVIDPHQAQVSPSITWAPIQTAAGAVAVPVCLECLPIKTLKQLDTDTKIPDAILKAGANGGLYNPRLTTSHRES